LSPGAEITAEDLFAGSEPEGDHASATALSASNHVLAATDNGESAMTFREAKEKFVGDWERDFFVRALRATGGKHFTRGGTDRDVSAELSAEDARTWNHDREYRARAQE